MRILAESAYPPIAASTRVRVLSFVPYLADYGIQADYMPALSDDEYRVIAGSGSILSTAATLARCGARLALRSTPQHDGLWVHRLGFLTPLPRIEPRTHLDVYDLDDALFLGSISDQNRRFAIAKRDAQRCAAYVRSARLVIVGNAYLADRVRAHSQRVEIVPSCVDCVRQPLHNHIDGETVTVGWIGSRTTSSYLQEVLPVFDRLNANQLRAKLVLIGADLPLQRPWLEQRPWSLERQYDDIAGFDIGIMPLPDSEWARGKCGYKLLQYFAAGIPAVASPVGVNTAFVGDERGRLATTATEWEQALLELAGDVSARREMGVNARAFAETNYSYERWAPTLAELLRSAVTRRDDGGRAVSRNGARGSGLSVVVTVRNDREDLRELLPGLANQTLKPDEILIVDGGSTDGTLDVLQDFRVADTPVRVIVAPGANIAAGRNVGVQMAENELIACTDAGCRPAPDWLAALRAHLEFFDLVGGVFIAEGQSELEQIVSLTHYPLPEELDDPGAFVRVSHRLFGRQYLANRAGGRSMAFHRDVWRAVGGFPEIQYAGEDQAFARAAVDAGYKPGLAREAIVRWRPPGTWATNARMFYRYSRGDVRSKGRSRHVLRLIAWSAGPAILARGGWRTRALVGAGAAAYIALPVRRAQLAGIGPVAWWRIPAAVAVKDLSQMAGALRGTVDAWRGVPQPTPHPPPDFTGTEVLNAERVSESPRA